MMRRGWMRSLARSLAVGLGMLSAPAARAGTHGYIEGFLGWSRDGSYYAMTSAGTDEIDVPRLCLSKPGALPASWPKDIPAPEGDDACTERWDMIFTDNTDPAALVDKARKLITKPGAADKAARGASVALRRQHGEQVAIDVSRGGKRVARGFIELRFAEAPMPEELEEYWRADGGAVAVVIGYQPAAEPQEGYGPPRWLVVLPLDGSTAKTDPPAPPRQRAQQLNREGMQLLAAKKLEAAQDKFSAAIGADSDFSLAYYNFACVASLRKDKARALTALRHLAEVQARDPVAKQALAKGATDHDLDFVAEDPEAAKLLKRARK